MKRPRSNRPPEIARSHRWPSGTRPPRRTPGPAGQLGRDSDRFEHAAPNDASKQAEPFHTPGPITLRETGAPALRIPIAPIRSDETGNRTGYAGGARQVMLVWCLVPGWRSTSCSSRPAVLAGAGAARTTGSARRVFGAKYVELAPAPHGRYLCHVAGPLSMGLAGIVMRDTAAARLLTWSLR